MAHLALPIGRFVADVRDLHAVLLVSLEWYGEAALFVCCRSIDIHRICRKHQHIAVRDRIPLLVHHRASNAQRCLPVLLPLYDEIVGTLLGHEGLAPQDMVDGLGLSDAVKVGAYPMLLRLAHREDDTLSSLLLDELQRLGQRLIGQFQRNVSLCSHPQCRGKHHRYTPYPPHGRSLLFHSVCCVLVVPFLVLYT